MRHIIRLKNARPLYLWRCRAFSLVEMLLVIAVIGIVAAVGVPTVDRMNEASDEVRNRRNAQTIASICGSAKAAGKNFVSDADDPASPYSVIHAIRTGETITDGPAQGAYFGMPNLTEAEMAGALAYLRVVEGELHYIPAGDSVDPQAIR